MEAGTTPSPEETEPGYAGAAVAGAVLATLFFPLIALIAALILQGGQSESRKKSQLRTWAWASGGLLVLDFVLVLLAVGAFAGSGSTSISRSGVCVGGPDMGATATQVPGSKHKFVQPCATSGSQIITMP
jgi:hypothetical protein